MPRMAFGRICLIGDAAFALRPHIGVGTAKAADDAWQLGTARYSEPPRNMSEIGSGPGRLNNCLWPGAHCRGPASRVAACRTAPGQSASRPRSGCRCLETAFYRSAPDDAVLELEHWLGRSQDDDRVVDLLEVTEGLLGNAEHGGQHPRWKPADGLTNADVVLVFRRAGVLDDDC